MTSSHGFKGKGKEGACEKRRGAGQEEPTPMNKFMGSQCHYCHLSIQRTTTSKEGYGNKGQGRSLTP